MTTDSSATGVSFLLLRAVHTIRAYTCVSVVNKLVDSSDDVHNTNGSARVSRVYSGTTQLNSTSRCLAINTLHDAAQRRRGVGGRRRRSVGSSGYFRTPHVQTEHVSNTTLRSATCPASERHRPWLASNL